MSESKPRKLGRKDSRNLDVEIQFLEGLVRRDPSYVEALQLLGDDYTRRGKIAEGLRVDLQLKALRPEDPEVMFNLACSLALSGNLEAAADEVCRAILAGFRDFNWLRKESDFAVLRKHLAYGRVRKLMKSILAETTQ